jgi:hypothetical protein
MDWARKAAIPRITFTRFVAGHSGCGQRLHDAREQLGNLLSVGAVSLNHGLRAGISLEHCRNRSDLNYCVVRYERTG